jgi:uncharacterized membrane protein
MKIILLIMAWMVCSNCLAQNSKTMEKDVLYFAKHVSVSINRPTAEVYAFASNPENLPQWASGLSTGIRKEGNEWISDSPMGKVKVRFEKKNEFGILDHKVVLPSGEVVSNPMRVFPNNKGSEVVFTVYRLPGRTDEEYITDANTVEADLKKLKSLLEK